jgi:hypothetical protein
MRAIVKVGAAAAIVALAAWPVPVGAQANPTVRITTPRDGATVRGPQVEVKVTVQNFRLVAGGTEVKSGEGHVHILIDKQVPRAGEVVPQADGYVHLGAAPFDTRTIDLAPGEHTLTAVLGDSTHKVLDPPATHSVKVTVEGDAATPPTRPANTGDGSLADQGPGAAAVAALVVGLLALALRLMRRVA